MEIKVNANIGGVEYLKQDPKWVANLIEKLKVAFCEEMNAWYSYIITEKFLVGGERKEIADTYEDNAKDEYEDHAEWLLERINQLNGSISDICSPEDWKAKTTRHPYVKPTFSNGNLISSVDNLQLQIKNELGAIETYNDLVNFTCEKDPVTYTKVKEILGDEQGHYQELVEHLADIQHGTSGNRRGVTSNMRGGRLRLIPRN